MLDKTAKLIVTVVMWLALAGLMIAGMINLPALREAWTIIPITVIPLTIGFFVTLALWAPGTLPWVDADRIRAMQGDSEHETSKRKRDASSADPQADDRLNLLLTMMTPEEREDFLIELRRRVLEDATMGEDGEIHYGRLSMQELLDEEARRR